jgi:hypothetical protein
MSVFRVAFTETIYEPLHHFFLKQNYCVAHILIDSNSVEMTNKMQPCIRIYYSTVHRSLNMFRAAYRSSSGALTVFAASGLHTHVVTGRSQDLTTASHHMHM